MATPKVMIGVQVRSGSQRLPGKALALIGNHTMIDRVVRTCRVAAYHLGDQGRCEASVSVLIPKGDRVSMELHSVDVFEGSDEDVLSRYAEHAATRGVDYVVRITGDCPMVPAWAITRITGLGVSHGYDYISNVDERFRTAIDGSDVEVFSRRMLVDAAERATSPADREHVTTIMRRDPPKWAKLGFVINHFDLSWIKLSVDTEDDLERVRTATDSAAIKTSRAIDTFGKKSVHIL